MSGFFSKDIEKNIDSWKQDVTFCQVQMKFLPSTGGPFFCTWQKNAETSTAIDTFV